MTAKSSEAYRAKLYFQGDVGNSTLVNKLGITNQQQLEKIEGFYVEYALLNGLSKKACELSPEGLKQMHKELFADIYDWAGEYRTYTTGRGLPFCKPEFIDSSLQKIYKDLNAQITHGMKIQDFVKSSARFIGELNVIHPFLDGNGRTQRAVLSLLTEKAGFYLHVHRLNQHGINLLKIAIYMPLMMALSVLFH